ncbi:unnamed protein product [Ascophyllum nodosum]
MDNELAAAIVATQEQLGGLFQKPKLTEKLLSKAPFRFLQDIVLAVSASTGFTAGLYSGDELVSGAIKDKAAKIAFLDKLVALVGICSGYDIPVRPSKVVAGLEPEGTNALLATLGKCAKSTDLDFDEAVRRALEGEPPGRRSPPIRSSAPAISAADKNVGNKGGGDEHTLSSSGAKSEEKQGQNWAGDGGDGVERGVAGSAQGGSGGGGGGDEKASASAKHEIEAMGAAAKAMGAPHSRRASSRAAAPPAEAKSGNTATAGLGGGPSEGRDLTAAIDACTGEISVTRQMLEPIISRPKLSDKLLNMPPFRFLHDIVSEVTRQTGFGRGLYSEEEQDSSLVKAKPAKMAYLDKLIMLVGNSLNTLVDARPGKIVAGLEAENTNRMLQLLALAAAERPDSSRAVAAVLGSDKSITTSRRDSRVNAGGAGIDPNAVSGDQDRQQPPQQLERREPSIASDAKDSSHDGDHAATGRIRESPPEPSASETKGGAGDAGGRLNTFEEGKIGHETGPDSEAVRHRGGVGDEDTTADRAGEGARSMRPRTARRRPPAVRDKVKDLNDRGRPQLADEPRALPKISNTSNIMKDGDDDDDKESDNDAEVNEVHGGSRAFPTGGGDTKEVRTRGAKGETGHTAMVADILEEKQRAEERAKDAEAEAEIKGGGQGGQECKDTSNGGSGIRMGRLRGPRASSLSALAASTVAKAGASRSASVGGGGYGDADVAKLMDAIQMLCQSTHPLGKCLDFVHEDLSLMSQEMDHWKALHRDKAEALKTERAKTEAFLQPLRLQLRDLEHQVKESTVKINSVKASISANENKINSLLKLAVTS